MGYAYSNNGLSFRSWDQPTNLLSGEVYFAAAPTTAQLEASFPAYVTALAAQQAQASYATAIAAGLAITSTGTPAISGTYGTTQQDQLNLMGLQIAIATGVTVPSSYIDSTRTKRSLTVAQVTAIATAIFNYVAALDQWLATVESGGTATQPAATATIA